MVARPDTREWEKRLVECYQCYQRQERGGRRPGGRRLPAEKQRSSRDGARAERRGSALVSSHTSTLFPPHTGRRQLGRRPDRQQVLHHAGALGLLFGSRQQLVFFALIFTHPPPLPFTAQRQETHRRRHPGRPHRVPRHRSVPRHRQAGHHAPPQRHARALARCVAPPGDGRRQPPARLPHGHLHQ